LNIFPEERWIVKNLFLLQFFQGAGIAFFFTAAFASFLDKFPITQLPWVMIISAFLLWVVGYFYSKLEHAIGNLRLSLVVTIFITASILFFYIGFNIIHASWFYFLMLAWFNVLYLLNNLEFWGIATALFDTRQSKRLFGIISAGDIPAKFIGYTIALLIVSYVGIKNLLLTGAVCMLISLPYLLRISRSGLIAGQNHQHTKHHKKGKTKEQQKVNQLLKNYTLNALIRRLALLSLLVSCCIIIINYAFYSKVKEAYHNDIDLAKFIAFFLASLRLIAMIIKLIFTGRLINSLGIVKALFITPFIMILFILILLVTEFSMKGDNLLLYIFAATAIAVDALRAAINSPVLLIAMQPLPLHERLRAHNIVKGIMDPFASLFSGLILLIIFNIQQRIDLVSICYVLLFLAVFWVIGIFRVNHKYMQTLVKTITSRYFSREEFEMNNDEILNLISEKINKGDELEVINILQMLNSSDKPVPEEIIQKLLKHPSDKVKLETIRMIGVKEIAAGEGDLLQLAAHSPDHTIKAEAVKTLCRMTDDENKTADYINDPDPGIQQAVIAGMLQNKNELFKAKARNITNELSVSDDVQKRKTAIAIMQEVKDEYYFPQLLNLMKDKNTGVRELTLSAVGKATETESIEELFKLINSHPKKVFLAIENSGKNSLPVIISRIQSGNLSELQTEKLIALTGKIKSDQSVPALLQLLNKTTLTPYVVKALYRRNYHAGEETRKVLEDIAHKYLLYGAELLHMQQLLQQKKYPFDILNSSVNIELAEIQEVLLCIFGCLYDRSKIAQARTGLNMKNREQVANAMEIIDMTVRKDLAHFFNSLYEIESIDHRCSAIQKLFKEKIFAEVGHVLTRILSEKPILYHHWTKASSMYVAKKSSQHLDNKLLDKFINSEIQLLKETAIYAAGN
jgi:ATP/ADP translocase